MPFDESLNDEDRLSEVLTDYGVNFIEKNKDNPFFLFLAHYDVHVQLDADKDLIEKYLNKEKKGDYPGNAIYASMIEHIDRSVGRVVEKLAELGIEDNTVIVFFSDNGGLVSRFDKIPLVAKSKLSVYEGSDLQYVASSNAPLRGEKGTVFEGGIREPMIVKWPAKVKGGSKCKSLITSVDFYPTFAELAGIELPESRQIDGESFVSLLDEKAPHEERAIFWHYPVYHHGVPASAVRKGDWKLIHFLDDGHTELYNLVEDISEEMDLGASKPEKTKDLLVLLEEWREDAHARLPVKNPEFNIEKREEWGKHPDRRKLLLPPIVGTK